MVVRNLEFWNLFTMKLQKEAKETFLDTDELDRLYFYDRKYLEEEDFGLSLPHHPSIHKSKMNLRNLVQKQQVSVVSTNN